MERGADRRPSCSASAPGLLRALRALVSSSIFALRHQGGASADPAL